jgi:hypothetical protein
MYPNPVGRVEENPGLVSARRGFHTGLIVSRRRRERERIRLLKCRADSFPFIADMGRR